MAELQIVENASALRYGLALGAEGASEAHRGDCLLIRLGTSEVDGADDLSLPDDAPARPGELLLVVSPELAMDLGEAIQRAPRACIAARKGGGQHLDHSRSPERHGARKSPATGTSLPLRFAVDTRW